MRLTQRRDDSRGVAFGFVEGMMRRNPFGEEEELELELVGSR